jgi:hypothetical protein
LYVLLTMIPLSVPSLSFLTCVVGIAVDGGWAITAGPGGDMGKTP